MKKALFLVVAIIFVSASTALATTITVSTSAGQFTSVSGASQAFFNSPASATVPYTENGFTLTGDFGFYTGFGSGYHRNPYGDATQYVATPRDQSAPPQSFLVTFSSPTAYFGLYWGSLDTYNSITLHTSSGDVTFTGTQLSAYGVPIDGSNPSVGYGDPASSKYFNFSATGGTINSVTLRSENRALEVDNFARTPEPASLLLLGSGLFGLGLLRRRK